MTHDVRSSPAGYRAAILAATVLVVAALYFARDVLIPFTLAVLLAFLLNPLVSRVKHWGASHLVAVAIVSGVALVFVLVLAGFLALQVADMLDNLPGYLHNAQARLESIWAPIRSMSGKLSASVQELAAKSAEAPAAASSPASVPAAAPVTAEAQIGFFTAALQTLATPIALFCVVAVLAGAMLVQGSDLRDRLVRLVGDTQVSLTTKALDDVAERVSRYLLTQTMINGSLGLVIALALFLIGVPNALLWGLLWAVLRFLPYVGPWLGALMPIVTAFGVADDWIQPALTILLLIVVEVITNAILEPWLYGSGTGLSPVAVLVSAVFWAWLWGWIGLVLATPMTVCLAVLGRYVEPLSFLNVLLGDQPVLRPSVQLYQRLLSRQADNVRELMDQILRDRPLAEVFEHVLIPALHRIDADRRNGLIDSDQAAAAHEQVASVLDEIPPPSPGIQVAAVAPMLLGFPARDEGDALCGRMLQRLLAEHGITLEMSGPGQLSAELAELVAQRDADAVLVSAVDQSRAPHLQNIVRRIRARDRDAYLVVGIWEGDNGVSRSGSFHSSIDAVVVTTLRDAVEALRFASVRVSEPPRTAIHENARVKHISPTFQ